MCVPQLFCSCWVGEEGRGTNNSTLLTGASTPRPGSEQPSWLVWTYTTTEFTLEGASWTISWASYLLLSKYEPPKGELLHVYILLTRSRAGIRILCLTLELKLDSGVWSYFCFYDDWFRRHHLPLRHIQINPLNWRLSSVSKFSHSDYRVLNYWHNPFLKKL